jgi:putative (di)nucleoside polyphosphate hydrolase
VKHEDLPYRPCVGIVLLNRDGLIWIGRRHADHAEDPENWQMPQGGIDENEDPAIAARRELAEETGTDKAEIIGEAHLWHNYDLPLNMLGVALKGRYRGQRQKWFAMRFLGEDVDFNIHAPPGGHPPEFDRWRWASIDEVLAGIIAFKRPVYEAVLAEFRPLTEAGMPGVAAKS